MKGELYILRQKLIAFALENGIKADFWKKITIYWYYFNIARANKHKEKKTPLQIIMEQDPSIKKSIAAWQALDLTSVLSLHINHLLPTKEGGHNVPVHP